MKLRSLLSAGKVSPIRSLPSLLPLGGLIMSVVASAQSLTLNAPQPWINFGSVNLCAPGSTTPSPCSQTLALTYTATQSVSLGDVQVLTLGSPNLDFRLAAGSSCANATVSAGATCTVNVTFTPLAPGSREGGILILDQAAHVAARTLIFGTAVARPRLGFDSVAPRTLAAGFKQISQLALDGAGDVFVADSTKLTKVAPNGSMSILGTGLNSPVGVALDGAGDLYIADSGLQQVEEIPAGGTPQTTIPFTGESAPVQPFALAVDGPGDLFVADLANSHVLERPAAGGPQVTVGGEAGGFLDKPGSIAADLAGDLYAIGYNSDVASYYLAEIPAGATAQTILLPPPMAPLLGMSLDGLGDLFAGSDYNYVAEYPPGQATPIQIGNGLPLPAAVAVDGAGNLFVGETQGLPDNVTGTLVELPRATPPPLNFSTVDVGLTSVLPLTLANTGSGILTVSPSFDNSSFSIVAAQPADCLAGIAQGQECALQIQFAPTAAGVSNGTLTLTTNGLDSPSVSLQGAGAEGTGEVLFDLPSGVYVFNQGRPNVAISTTLPGATIHFTLDGSAPTAASPLYTAPISIPVSSNFLPTVLKAIAIAGSTQSAVTTGSYLVYPDASEYFQASFPGSQNEWLLNGSANIAGDRLDLTSGGQSQTGSAFQTRLVNLSSAFFTDFTFQLSSPDPSVPLSQIADGFTFVILSQSTPPGPHTLGRAGGSLGYEGIPGHSLAFKFDLHDNFGEGNNSTGLCFNGASPTYCSSNLNGSGIDLHSGHPFLAQIGYDGQFLRITITDLINSASWSHAYDAQNFASILDLTNANVYMGFTGATGGKTARLEILNWSFASGIYGPVVPPIDSSITYANGFSPTSSLTLNGSASLSNILQLTDGSQYQAASAFFDSPVNAGSAFTTDFNFQLTSPITSTPLSPIGDGFAFVLVNMDPSVTGGAAVLGNDGKDLGFGGILANHEKPPSYDLAVKFDLHDNAGEGSDSTGLYLNCASPTAPAVNLTGTGIDLHSGHIFHAKVDYTGVIVNGTPQKELVLTLTDTVTQATWSHTFPVDIPAAIGPSQFPPNFGAYAGFTASTGAKSAKIQILNWTFSNID